MRDRCEDADPVFLRTPESQRYRKEEGSEIERLIGKNLKSILPEECSVIINTREGIDIFLRDCMLINVEVKSINRFERVSYKGKESSRSGRFIIKDYDYIKSDFFAFVVKEIDNNFNWDRKRPLFIKYVKTSDVVKFLKSRNLYGKDNIKIPIFEVEMMDELDVVDFLNKLVED